MGAQPSGAPGWPLLAFSTVSTASSRKVSIDSSSRESSARLEVMVLLSNFLSLKCEMHLLDAT